MSLPLCQESRKHPHNQPLRARHTMCQPQIDGAKKKCLSLAAAPTDKNIGQTFTTTQLAFKFSVMPHPPFPSPPSHKDHLPPFVSLPPPPPTHPHKTRRKIRMFKHREESCTIHTQRPSHDTPGVPRMPSQRRHQCNVSLQDFRVMSYNQFVSCGSPSNRIAQAASAAPHKLTKKELTHCTLPNLTTCRITNPCVATQPTITNGNRGFPPQIMNSVFAVATAGQHHHEDTCEITGANHSVCCWPTLIHMGSPSQLQAILPVSHPPTPPTHRSTRRPSTSLPPTTRAEDQNVRDVKKSAHDAPKELLTTQADVSRMPSQRRHQSNVSLQDLRMICPGLMTSRGRGIQSTRKS